MAIINISQNILVYDDEDIATSNPKRRNVDWTTDVNGVRVTEPSSREYQLQPGEESTIFSGTRTLTVDDTTTFDLTLNTLYESVYRLTAVSGTAPGFRTKRAVDLSSESVTVTINNNATAEFALTEGSSENFSAVSVGDVLFIPDATTGDSVGPFSVLNGGFWTVLAIGLVGMATAHKLVVKRLNGEGFQGTNETVTVASADQFIVFSAAGVQVNDTLRLIDGFSQITRQSYQISKVTDSWIEFTSTQPLPLESGIVPDDTGIAIYEDAKSFVRVEADQECAIRLNGMTGDELTATPREPGTKAGVGHFELWGSIYQLVLVNKSTSDIMKATVISVVKQ